ncbi:MAG: NERD domain-containing protein [Candidatus Bathyarchaeota archaeon]|nr:NERD domain-containing protein [Candidatus Bathyarchaeum sp.]
MEPINPPITISNEVNIDREELKKTMSNKEKGELGERFTCEAFENSIVFKNIPTTKFGGDIDSIIIKDGVLFWIEVKNVNTDFIISPDWSQTHVEARFDDAHEYKVQGYADKFGIKDIVKMLVIPEFVIANPAINYTLNEINLHIVETHRQALSEEDAVCWKNTITDFVDACIDNRNEDCNGNESKTTKDSTNRSVKINTGIALDYGLEPSFRALLLVLFIKKYYLKHFIEHFTKQKTPIFHSTISDEFETLAHFTIHQELNEHKLKGGWDLTQARGRVSKMEDMNDIHDKTLYLLGKLDDYGIRPLDVDRVTLLKYVMGILMCSRRCANRWVNFLYRLSWKDWY